MHGLKSKAQRNGHHLHSTSQRDKTLKMSERLRDIHKELSKLKKLGPSARKKFLKSCSKSCVLKVCECIQNLLKANLEIKPAHLRKLSRHKHTLRELAQKRTSFIKRKQLLQKGGFITALLPAILPALAGLIGGLTSNQNG